MKVRLVSGIRNFSRLSDYTACDVVLESGHWIFKLRGTVTSCWLGMSRLSKNATLKRYQIDERLTESAKEGLLVNSHTLSRKRE